MIYTCAIIRKRVILLTNFTKTYNILILVVFLLKLFGGGIDMMFTQEDTEKIESIRLIISTWFSGEYVDDFEALEVYEEMQLMA